MSYKKTIYKLTELKKEKDHEEIANMAIETIEKLNSNNKKYKEALKVCKEAIQKNLSHAMFKDEHVLLDAFKEIEKALKK